MTTESQKSSREVTPTKGQERAARMLGIPLDLGVKLRKAGLDKASGKILKAFLSNPEELEDVLELLGVTVGRIVIELGCMGFSKGNLSLMPEELIVDAAFREMLLDAGLDQKAQDKLAAEIGTWRNEKIDDSERTKLTGRDKIYALQVLGTVIPGMIKRPKDVSLPPINPSANKIPNFHTDAGRARVVTESAASNGRSGN